MQKYRKWTDQATGINPFIIADQKKHNLFYNSITILKSIIITLLFFVFSPIILIVSIIPFLSFINRILTILCGMVFTYDDSKFLNNVQKMKKNKIILSNFGSIIDVFYYMSKLPGVKFMILHQFEDKYLDFEIIHGLGCLIKVFTQRQPFYVFHKSLQKQKKTPKQNSFKALIQKYKDQPLVFFYQGIRTNGLGTIKFPRQISQKLYELEKSYLIAKINSLPRDQLFHNLVRSPLYNIFRSFGSLQPLTIKVRSQIIDSGNIHNVNDIKKEVDEFMSTNGSKLLQTNPEDYQNFLQFYQKTQISNYVLQ